MIVSSVLAVRFLRFLLSLRAELASSFLYLNWILFLWVWEKWTTAPADVVFAVGVGALVLSAGSGKDPVFAAAEGTVRQGVFAHLEGGALFLP